MIRNSSFLISILLVLAGCGPQQSVQGPGSETIAFAGRAVYQSEEPVSGATVTARKENYLPSLPANSSEQASEIHNQTVTDERGNYTLALNDTGTYLIEINDHNSFATLIPCTISTQKVILPQKHLTPTGAITGDVVISESDSPLYVRVYGLERIVKVDTVLGTFSIPDMPEGTFDLHITAGGPDNRSYVVDDLEVSSSKATYTGTIDIESGTRMENAQRIILNTSPSGAYISEDVYDFPVLVRLNQSNFDFNQTATDGSNLRFTDENGNTLSHSIERYDAALKRAEIWVLVDTIYADNNTQSIQLHWGTHNNPLTGGKEVFDTANGFQSVFHFTQSTFDTLYDATPNQNIALFGGDSYAADVEGAVGLGFDFDGTADFFSISHSAETFNFSDDASYTLSAWVYVDTLTDSSHSIIVKGHYHYGLQLFETQKWEIYDYQNNSDWNAVRARANEKMWVLLTGIYDNGQMSLYVNTTLISDKFVIEQVADDETLYDVFLGRKAEQNSQFWKGRMDEVRICDVARSESWVKLSYMNQNPEDILLIFE